MKLNRRDYKEARDLAMRTLISLGIDMKGPANYDCRSTKKRYSVFNGRVTAVWDDAHFTNIPFGTFKVVG